MVRSTDFAYAYATDGKLQSAAAMFGNVSTLTEQAFASGLETFGAARRFDVMGVPDGGNAKAWRIGHYDGASFMFDQGFLAAYIELPAATFQLFLALLQRGKEGQQPRPLKGNAEAMSRGVLPCSRRLRDAGFIELNEQDLTYTLTPNGAVLGRLLGFSVTCAGSRREWVNILRAIEDTATQLTERARAAKISPVDQGAAAGENEPEDTKVPDPHTTGPDLARFVRILNEVEALGEIPHFLSIDELFRMPEIERSRTEYKAWQATNKIGSVRDLIALSLKRGEEAESILADMEKRETPKDAGRKGRFNRAMKILRLRLQELTNRTAR